MSWRSLIPAIPTRAKITRATSAADRRDRRQIEQQGHAEHESDGDHHTSRSEQSHRSAEHTRELARLPARLAVRLPAANRFALIDDPVASSAAMAIIV